MEGSYDSAPFKGVCLSVVIPVFNEEEVIGECVRRVSTILNREEIDHEILIVNDGSTDATLTRCLALRSLGHKIRVIDLGKNYGHMQALRSGLEASEGNFIATLDADLQDPPEYMPEMLRHLITSERSESNEDNQVEWDVVQAYRLDRSSDSFPKRKLAAIYYWIISRLTGIKVIPHAAEFRIMSRQVVDELKKLAEPKLVYRLLIPSLGFRIKEFPITRSKRFAGNTSYTMRKMIGLALESVVSFTYRPLRIMSLLGLVISFTLFLAAVCVFIISIVSSTVPGWGSIVLLMLSVNSMLFAAIGLLGEYVGRIYEMSLSRPRPQWNEK